LWIKWRRRKDKNIEDRWMDKQDMKNYQYVRKKKRDNGMKFHRFLVNFIRTLL
jgi:hypothetical protein